MTIQQLKQRFGIIGNSEGLNRAIDIASQVAPTVLSVLITGESGSGKEVMPQIVHQLSSRKHNQYIAVNCGAIPEGTIDSELFGHEKGSFTGAHDSRKGYFEVADGGTIFLDEVAELPMQTQARLLRVLESGEFLKVGSSKVLKTDVRIVAATNVNIPEAIQKSKFREDLYYRLNTVPIEVPSLRNRKGDIHLIFRKFASDFAEKYKMPSIHLSPNAVQLLEKYRWPGNVRQLKNVTEQISVIEQQKEISGETLLKYLPENSDKSLPILYTGDQEGLSEREILYKVLFDMKNDVTELKKIVFQVVNSGGDFDKEDVDNKAVEKLFKSEPNAQANFDSLRLPESSQQASESLYSAENHEDEVEEYQEVEQEEESLSISETEKRLIKKALEKHNGKRKYASEDLGISERTLYRKIKEYDIEQ